MLCTYLGVGGTHWKEGGTGPKADTGSFGPRIPGLYIPKGGLEGGGCGLWWVPGRRNMDTGQNQAL